jgi:endonuclease III
LTESILVVRVTPSNQQRDQAVYRVSKRITEELPKDIAVLAEHRPDKLEELREMVCEKIDEE